MGDVTRLTRERVAEIREWADGQRAGRALVVDDAMIERMAHAMAVVTHPVFRGEEEWEWAVDSFKAHYRDLARRALRAAFGDGAA